MSGRKIALNFVTSKTKKDRYVNFVQFRLRRKLLEKYLIRSDAKTSVVCVTVPHLNFDEYEYPVLKNSNGTDIYLYFINKAYAVDFSKFHCGEMPDYFLTQANTSKIVKSSLAMQKLKDSLTRDGLYDTFKYELESKVDEINSIITPFVSDQNILIDKYIDAVVEKNSTNLIHFPEEFVDADDFKRGGQYILEVISGKFGKAKLSPYYFDKTKYVSPHMTEMLNLYNNIVEKYNIQKDIKSRIESEKR